MVFEVQARWNGPTVQAAGSTEIRRSDFGVGVRGLAGFNVDETVTVEFELTFAPGDAVVSSPPPTLVDNPAAVTDEEPTVCAHDGGPPVELSAPILVTAAQGDRSAVAVVAGTDRVTPLVTPTGLTGGVAWSPDGARALYSASADPEAPRTLASVDAGAAGGAPAPVPGLVDVLQPDQGPDGRIAFVQRSGDTSDIWVADRDGGDARRLVATPGDDSDPRWSPDGDAVVFTTVAGADNQDVVVVDADGADLRTLAGGPGYEFAPSFAGRGRTVLFSRDGALHAVDLDGGDERRLTDGDQDVNPEVSPDGTQLAFLRDGSLQVASADGSAPRCLATGRGITGGPRWRPGS